MQYICPNAEECNIRLQNLTIDGDRDLSTIETCKHRVPHYHSVLCTCSMCGGNVGQCIKYISESPIKVDIVETEEVK